MSIAKAQAQALADGFLNSLGVDKNGLVPRETYSELIVLAGELIDDAQQNLAKSNSVSSGSLSESMVANEPVATGGQVTVDVFMNFYGKFIDAGVKGTKAGGSTAGYAFKYDMPSKSMVDAITEWLKRGSLTTSSVKKYTGYGSHERKQKKLGKISEANVAFAVARSIKQQGIRATGFMGAAIRSTSNKVADRLGAALKVDIHNSLNGM